MNLGKLIVVVIILLNSFITYAQELKKKRKFSEDFSEEFTVLKENKKIKHGQYLKYRTNSLGDREIISLGQYNNGARADKWYFFYAGYLSEEGSYVNNEKEGKWVEYYRPIENTKRSVYDLFEVNEGVSISKDGNILIERAGLIISSEGEYYQGKKSKVWNYYSLHGETIHIFDYSTNNVLFSFDNLEGENYPFLGGKNRFFLKFYQQETLVVYEEKDHYKTYNIKIKKIDETTHYRANHPLTDKTLETVVSNLKAMEDDFLWENSEELLFILELIPNPGGMFGDYKMSFSSNVSIEN